LVIKQIAAIFVASRQWLTALMNPSRAAEIHGVCPLFTNELIQSI
jgi:hypothetical protein